MEQKYKIKDTAS